MHIFHSYKTTYKRHYSQETLVKGYLSLPKPSRLHLLENSPFDYADAIVSDGVTLIEKECSCGSKLDNWQLGKH